MKCCIGMVSKKLFLQLTEKKTCSSKENIMYQEVWVGVEHYLMLLFLKIRSSHYIRKRYLFLLFTVPIQPDHLEIFTPKCGN